MHCCITVLPRMWYGANSNAGFVNIIDKTHPYLCLCCSQHCVHRTLVVGVYPCAKLTWILKHMTWNPCVADLHMTLFFSMLSGGICFLHLPYLSYLHPYQPWLKSRDSSASFFMFLSYVMLLVYIVLFPLFNLFSFQFNATKLCAVMTLIALLFLVLNWMPFGPHGLFPKIFLNKLPLAPEQRR